jgi:hypothetical protein
MISSCLLRRLLLLLLFAVVSLSPDDANAQCPQGKPPNSDGTCGKRQKDKPVVAPPKPEKPRQRPPEKNYSASAGRSRNNNGPANTCSIDVRVIKQGGQPLAAVNLMLDDSMLNIGITNAAGTYKFANLPCNRNYKITPGHAEYIFTSASATIPNLTKTSSATFIASIRERGLSQASLASAREKSASNASLAPVREKIVSKVESRPCNPPPTYLPRVKFDDPLTGKLSPQTSFCDERTKGYFHSYQLDGALGGDIIQFDLQSEPASNLVIQVVDKAGRLIEMGAEGESDDPLGRQLVLPKAGDYTLRIIDRANRASDYRLSVIRKGLSDEGYRGQLERAYAAIAEPNKPTFYSSLNQHLERLTPWTGKASEQKINEATAILERLRMMAPNKPEAISMLATIQLYYRKDLAAARDLATKALELGGEARFRVDFGEKLDKGQRRVTDGNSPCWLIIKKGKVSCESFNPNEGEVFSSGPEWIAKKNLDISGYYLGLTIYGRGKTVARTVSTVIEDVAIDSFYFVPRSVLDLNTRFSLSEITLIRNFIKQFAEIN